jgi:hypothetical protein
MSRSKAKSLPDAVVSNADLLTARASFSTDSFSTVPLLSRVAAAVARPTWLLALRTSSKLYIGGGSRGRSW